MNPLTPEEIESLFYPALVLLAVLLTLVFARLRYQHQLSQRDLEHARAMAAVEAEQLRLREQLEQEGRMAREKLELLQGARKQLGDEMRDNESRGIDFCPPGGESPREVQARLQPWLRQLAGSKMNSAAVVHKGIIRCIYALACGWNMRGESPVEFEWDAIHQFELDSNGLLRNDYQSIGLLKR
jgi:broad specificity phosphatase PhoE